MEMTIVCQLISPMGVESIDAKAVSREVSAGERDLTFDWPVTTSSTTKREINPFRL